MLPRNKETPYEGLMCDIVWSDPEDIDGMWDIVPKGAGWLFGAKAVDQFFHSNKLSFMCRSHQLVMEGHNLKFDEKLVTVWSAPNYCYR